MADLVALVVNNGYDGLDLDYENFAFVDGRKMRDATLPNWTTFVAELGAAFHAQGKLLSATVPGPCDTRNRCGGRYDTGSTTFRGSLRTWIEFGSWRMTTR